MNFTVRGKILTARTKEPSSSSEFLGEFKPLVVLAVTRLDQKAYGVPIHLEIERQAERSVSRGAVSYTYAQSKDNISRACSWNASPALINLGGSAENRALGDRPELRPHLPAARLSVDFARRQEFP